ncbi:hypothetical protein KJ909_03550 [Patescibacteria group bacterium]|nr:hypothetical protein [Patescibacteria group bacterium]
MKVYFLASPRSIEERPAVFGKIYEYLARDNKMIDDLVKKLVKDGVKEFYEAKKTERTDRFKKWMNYVRKSEVVVVEVSGHSMTLGYVIGKALELNKPVVALCKEGEESYFVSGINNSKLQVVKYKEETVEEVLKGAMKKAKSMVDVRFNFFVSPAILTYLDWVAQHKMIPRSVFLRELIEKQMKKEKEFK